MGLRRRQQQIVGRLIAHLAPAGPSARLAEAYLREGDLLTLLKRFNAADRALSTALRISCELADARLERNILRSIGLLRWHEGRIAEALAQTEEALCIDRECGDEDAVAGDLVNLANILKEMGDYAGALSRIEEALAMPSVVDNPKKLSFALHNLANVHRGHGQHGGDAGAACASRMRTRHTCCPSTDRFISRRSRTSSCSKGASTRRFTPTEKAIELSRRAHHAEGLAQSLRTLGEVLFELGRHGDALPYLVEAARAVRAARRRRRQRPTCGVYAAQRARAHGAACRGARRVEARAAAVPPGRRLAGPAERDGRRRADDAPDRRCDRFERCGVRSRARHGVDARRVAPRARLPEHARDPRMGTRERYADALKHYEGALLLAREHGDRDRGRSDPEQPRRHARRS